MKFGSRKPYTDVLGMNEMGFEWYVCSIFNELPGWTAFQPTKTNARDFSADVYALSPYGTKYVIQCKHFLSPNSKVGVKDVGYLAGTLPKHQAAFGIFITAHNQEESSEDDNYTREARLLATSNGVRLWGLKELSQLVEAGETGLAHHLINLGLEAQAPQPPAPPALLSEPATNPIAQAAPRALSTRSRQLWLLPIAIFALGAGWFGRDAQQLILGDNSQAAIEQLMRDYDQAYQADLNYGQARLAGRFMEPLLYEDFAAILDQRTKQGCNLTTEEITPFKVQSVEWLGDGLARVAALKSWRQTLNCTGKASRVIANGPFEVEYIVGKLNTGTWIVVNSSRL